MGLYRILQNICGLGLHLFRGFHKNAALGANHAGIRCLLCVTWGAAPSDDGVNFFAKTDSAAVGLNLCGSGDEGETGDENHGDRQNPTILNFSKPC